MTSIAPPHTTKVLAGTAVLAAILFTVGQASAGTQMPYWKKKKLENEARRALLASQNTDNTPIVVVEEVTPPDNGSDNGQTGGDTWPGDMGSGGGDQPVAAPSPSAVLGGLAMLGLIAGRRNRKTDDA